MDLEYEKPFPNTLTGIFDNILKIPFTLFERPVAFVHGKGYQDRSSKVDKLMLEALLNIEADREAGRYRSRSPRYRPNVPRLPSNKDQLTINGKTITGHYRPAIRYADSAPALHMICCTSLLDRGDPQVHRLESCGFSYRSDSRGSARCCIRKLIGLKVDDV